MGKKKSTTTDTEAAEAQLKIIHDFAAKNHGTDPEHVTALLADAIEIAREIGDIAMLIKSLWRRGIGLRVLLKEDEAVDNLQEALKLAETHGTKKEVAGILETLGLTYYTFNRYKEAAYSHLKSAEIFAELGVYREQAKAISDVAAVLFVEGNLSSAVEFCKQGFAICQKHSVAPPLQLYHNNALIYGEIGEISKALEYHLLALKEAESMGHVQFQATLLSSVAAMYEKNGDIDLAYEYSAKVIALHSKFHHPSTKILALVNSIDVLLLLGKLDEAEKNVAEAYAIIEQHGFKARKHYVLFIDGVLQKTKRNFLKAHELFDEALALWEDGQESRLKVKIYLEKARISEHKEREELLLKALHDNIVIEGKDVLPDIYLALSEHYESAGDTASAIKYHKLFHVLKEQIQGEKAKRHFQVIQVEHEAERKEKEAEILRLENEKLAQNLEHGKEQLSTLASYLTQKNQVLSAIQKNAGDALKAKGGSLKNHLRQILKLSAENSENFWEQFEKRFETVYGDFHERLVRKHPDLSPMEVRVCILTRAGLPNKETGELLSISNRTVESHRSSIRKKLGLERTANLTSYLALL
jgi:DNA-binding CsgD family transcriptional regulator/tetratricopeptide (TPR) repeat protein